ncbi:HAD-IA family hydrolase [Neisseria sp. Dent CA1/247]|uniref:HAD-IA family hydrolase n=1 Tax=Neisseria sp. Dent CA1/247 TaxID=2912675 RepID=UPI001FD44A57|nr:HAD-IA family hydrolase [Neisseria sp. Dent CA1/247]UOO78172.1 HAD-IA family hydrolase [Neisseria sp. Dent CA1/247]
MKPKLIIFDWDGTLADTTGPIINTFQHTFADCGLPAPEADTIRSLIGYNLVTIIHRLIPDADQHLKEQLAETYAHHYLNPNNHNMRLFDSALPCLRTLKEQGYWLAVATGKGRIGLDKAIAQTGTADFWLATTCASEQPSKPAPDMVFKLCDELGLQPADSVVVGDTVYDLEMAANAGAPAIAVATGAHSAAQLAGQPCLAVLKDLSALPEFLSKIQMT